MSQILNIQNTTSSSKAYSDVALFEWFVLAEDGSYDTCQKISDGVSNNVLNQKKKIIITCQSADKIVNISQITISVEKL